VPVTTGRARRLLAGAALVGALTARPAPATAQDALMTSAAGVARGSYLVSAYPMLVPGGDSELGFLLRGSHGVTGRMAAHASLGFYNDLTYVGGLADLRLPWGGPVDLSVSFGLHYSKFARDGADIFGLDLAVVGHHPLGRRLAVYGGLDLDFEGPEDPYDNFTRARLVGGVETGVLGRVRLLVEGGLGFNERSPEYLSVGLVYRLR
jgi:hypothetical protein